MPFCVESACSLSELATCPGCAPHRTGGHLGLAPIPCDPRWISGREDDLSAIYEVTEYTIVNVSSYRLTMKPQMWSYKIVS